MSLQNGLLFAGAAIFQLIGVLLLPATKGMTQPLPTLGVALGYGIGVICMSRMIVSGMDLSLMIPLLTVAIMFAAVAAGMILYGDTASPIKIGALIVAGVMVGIASRY
jgi:small multidrug resistance pump